TGSRTESSNPTTISSTIAATLGTSWSISPGASCPLDCASLATATGQRCRRAYEPLQAVACGESVGAVAEIERRRRIGCIAFHQDAVETSRYNLISSGHVSR